VPERLASPGCRLREPVPSSLDEAACCMQTSIQSFQKCTSSGLPPGDFMSAWCCHVPMIAAHPQMTSYCYSQKA
jgi:hypothetical protein